MPKIQQLLFDCDNTLVLSETIAFKGCALLANEVLEKHGVPATYTGKSLSSKFVGMNFNGVLEALQQAHDFKMTDEEVQSYVSREVDVVTKLLSEEATSCPGSDKVLEDLYKEGKYKMAIVSSSALKRVKASVHKTGQDKYFDQDHIYSAATSLPVPTSKPNPAVYLYACKELGVPPEKCLAIEDSRSGALAAKRAGIPTIGYVGPYEDPEEQEAMITTLREECGVLEIMYHWDEFTQCLEKIERG